MGGIELDLSLSEEEIMLQKTVKEFVERVIAPRASEIDRRGEFPWETVKEMANHGFFGIPIPERYGGAGFSSLAYYLAIEEISKACASTGVIVETHTSLVCKPILKWGTDEQKERYLIPLARGEKLGSFALTEPDAGSDISAISTTARAEGDHWVLNGTKMFITNAGASEVILVFAKTCGLEEKKSLSAFIVDTSTPGLSVGASFDKLGVRGSLAAEVVLDNVRIPRENVLGEPGEGFRIAMEALDGGRVAIAAQALGILEAAFEASLKYSSERVQFGKPISEKQAIQFMLADMAVDIEASRLLIFNAAFLEATGKRFTKEAAMAKLFASEAAMRHCVKAVQIHGGYGYTREYPVERYMRDAKVTEIYEGTSEIQRLVIASSLLKAMKDK